MYSAYYFKSRAGALTTISFAPDQVFESQNHDYCHDNFFIITIFFFFFEKTNKLLNNHVVTHRNTDFTVPLIVSEKSIL